MPEHPHRVLVVLDGQVSAFSVSQVIGLGVKQFCEEHGARYIPAPCACKDGKANKPRLESLN